MERKKLKDIYKLVLRFNDSDVVPDIGVGLRSGETVYEKFFYLYEDENIQEKAACVVRWIVKDCFDDNKLWFKNVCVSIRWERFSLSGPELSP